MGHKKKHKITNDADPGEPQVKKKREFEACETCPDTVSESVGSAEALKSKMKKHKKKSSTVSDGDPEDNGREQKTEDNIKHTSRDDKNHSADLLVDKSIMKGTGNTNRKRKDNKKHKTEMKTDTLPLLNKEPELIPAQSENNSNRSSKKKKKAKKYKANKDTEDLESSQCKNSNKVKNDSREKGKEVLKKDVNKEELATLPKMHMTTQNMLLAKLKNAQSKRKVQLNHDQQSCTEKSEKTNDESDNTRKEDQNIQDIVIEGKTEPDNSGEKIDAEKLAIKEKKLEKRKQKKLGKERQKKEQEEKAGTAKISAIDYLDKWKNNREEWKFNKVRQCWLLQNMYKEPLVDDDHFNILLEYLDGLKGKSREITRKEAEGILHLDSEEDDDEKVTDDQKCSKPKVDAAQHNRARQIIQLLAE